MEDNNLGSLLRAKRESLGLSQDAVGQQIGAEGAYVSQIESGIKKWPRKYVAALSKALDIPLDVMEQAAGRRRSVGYGARITQPSSALFDLVTSYFDEDRARARIVELLPSLHGMALAVMLQAAEASAEPDKE